MLQPPKGKFIYANSIGVTHAASPDEQYVHDLTAFVTLAAALFKSEGTPPVAHMPGVWLRQIECSYTPGDVGETGAATISGVATGALTRTGCTQEGPHTLICYFKFTLKAGLIEGRPDVEKYSTPSTRAALPALGLDRDIYMAVHQRALQAMSTAGYLRELPGCVRLFQAETKSVSC